MERQNSNAKFHSSINRSIIFTLFDLTFERYLHVSYNEKTSLFKYLMEIDGFIQRYKQNSQTLVTEMFKMYDSIAPPLLTKIEISIMKTMNLHKLLTELFISKYEKYIQ